MPYSWLSSIRSLILDMDGVIWRGDQEIGTLSDIFSIIKNTSLSVVLATNNSTASTDQYLSTLAGFGVSLEPWQIVNSSQATAYYLKQIFPDGGPVYIIGEEGLVEALNEFGFFHSHDGSIAVVAGMDRHITYDKLKTATLLIRAGTKFIATNPDKTFPTPEGLVPGAGAIIAYLEASTGENPHMVGKPSPEMYFVAMDRLNISPEKTLVVGDRLETDIAGAQAIGCRTALVLSGVTDEITARNWEPEPDMIAADLSKVLHYFE